MTTYTQEQREKVIAELREAHAGYSDEGPGPTAFSDAADMLAAPSTNLPIENIPGLASDESTFIRWAEKEKYDTSSHPMFFVMLDEKTNAARMGWKAAMAHCETLKATPSTSQRPTFGKPGSRDVDVAAAQVAWDAAQAAPSATVSQYGSGELQGLILSKLAAPSASLPNSGDPVANNDEVICPTCCNQFRAIPVNVQQLMLDAGFEPPFSAPSTKRANGKLTVTLQDTEGDGYKRMFEAACVALGEIGDALGCDPNEGGAEPILDAIAELKLAAPSTSHAMKNAEILQGCKEIGIADSIGYMEVFELGVKYAERHHKIKGGE